MTGRVTGHVVRAAGVALIGVGVTGLVAHAADTHPAGWAVWFAGAVLAHDLLLAPLVAGVAFLTGRIPAPYRRPAQVALVLCGTVTAVALPMVLGFGRRPDEPSRLPLDYGRNLAVIVAGIGLVCALFPVVNAYARVRWGCGPVPARARARGRGGGAGTGSPGGGDRRSRSRRGGR